MRPSTRFPCFALPAAALALAGTGFAAWQFHHQAQALRTELAQLEADHRRLESIAMQHDLRRTDLNRQIAAMESNPAPAASSPTPSPSTSRPPDGPSGPHGNVYFPELFSDPHYAEIYLNWQRNRIAVRYAPVLAELGLPADQLARLREILAQKEMAYEEVDGILETQAMLGKKPTDRSAAMKTKMMVNRTFDEEIERTFGSTVTGKLREFLSSTGARQDWLDAFALRLSYSPHPLTRAQSDALIKAYNENRSIGPALVSDAFLARGESILQPNQMVALRQLKAELDASRGGTSLIRTSTGPAPLPQK